MKSLLGVMTFIFLIIIAPVFLIAIGASWNFASILAGWSVVAAVATPLGWAWYRRHAAG